MFTQSSNPSFRNEISENDTQFIQKNPNEADSTKQNMRRKITRERSDIIKRLNADLDGALNPSMSAFSPKKYNPESISR